MFAKIMIANSAFIMLAMVAGALVSGALVSGALAADAAREQAIRECSAEQKKNPNQTWGGTTFYTYRACMARHGQPE